MKLRELSEGEIIKLATRRGGKEDTVQNFLMSLNGLSSGQAYKLLSDNRKAFRWNLPTTQACADGILQATCTGSKEVLKI